MFIFALRRIGIAIPVLLGVTIVIFVLTELLPGDAVDFLIPPESAVSSVTLEQMRERFGLDAPLPVRYGIWMGQLVRGNLGYRLKNNDPVSYAIGNRFPPTIILISTAILLGLVVGVPLGVISALRRYSVIDTLLTAATFISISLPAFFAGLLALYVFALKLRLFPAGGMLAIASGRNSFLDLLYHLALPAAILSLNYIALFLRYTRSGMLEVMGSDYIRTARAKGLSNSRVVMKHGFRNALTSVITVFGLMLPNIVGGAVFTETVFSWPGMGTLFVDAVNSRDYPLILGITLIIAVAVQVANILVDLTYGVVNPRIRYA